MTKHFQKLLPTTLLRLAVALLCAVSTTVARADHAVTTVAPEGHNDGIAYLIILFCVALSVIILCRGANRSSDMRLKDLEEE